MSWSIEMPFRFLLLRPEVLCVQSSLLVHTNVLHFRFLFLQRTYLPHGIRLSLVLTLLFSL
ncbi:hypothetical protein OIU78_013937 [Salix suchowensis]|nr:hypothetical protein OIU78_013937 [Salix suchowensis]